MSSALTLDRPTGISRGLFGWDSRPVTQRTASRAVSSSTAQSAEVSEGRDALLDYAATRLDALRERGVSELAAVNTLLALQSLVKSDAATPQVGIDGDGGIETEWLVDGRSLILNCGVDGTNVLWALDEDCQMLFRREFNARMVDESLLGLARDLIDRMNRGVRNSVRSS